MKDLIPTIVTSVVIAGLLATPGVAHADDEESPISAVADAAPDALASVAQVETIANGSGQVIDETVGGTAITIPSDASERVTLSAPTSGSSLTIELPFADQARPAETDAPGIVSYDNANGTTTVPLVNTDGSVTIATIIDSSDAPSSFPYSFGSSAEVTLAMTEDGGATVTGKNGELIAKIAPPWARDASGAEVPTSYEISGNTLTQHVDLSDPAIQYPVVADPSTTFVWWGTATKLTKKETQSLAQNISSASSGVAAFCGYIPVVHGRVACAIAVVWRISSWIDPVRQAAAQGKCAQINIPYASGPVLWNVTKERC